MAWAGYSKTTETIGEQQYTVHTFDFTSWANKTLTKSDVKYCTVNKTDIYLMSAPTEFGGIIAMGNINNEKNDDSKSWWLRQGGSGKNYLYSYGGPRNAAFINLPENSIVTFSAAVTFAEATGGAGSAEWTASADGLTATITKAGDLGWTGGKNSTYTRITVKTPIIAGVCENPTYKLAAANTSRKFTLSCGTQNSVIYYSETEKTVEDEGWTKYTSEVTTNAETIYAYAKTDNATSDVISFATGAGTEIQLNAPVINRNSYSAGNYSVSFSSTQTDLPIIPSSVTYSYSIDGGDAQTGNSATIPEGSTITVSTISDGYANSDAMAWTTSARPSLIDVWKEDYTNLTSATGNGAYGVVLSSEVAFSCNEKEFKNITGYNSGTTVDVTVNTNVGLSTDQGFYLRCKGNNSGILQNTKDAYLGIDNLEPGQMIVITSSAPLTADYGLTYEDGMSTATEYYFTATETTASILVTKGTYNYVKTISVKKPGVTISLPAGYIYSTFSSELDLDFTGNADVEAYIAYSNDGKNVTLKKVTKVPAGNGLVLKKLGATTTTVPVLEDIYSITPEEQNVLSDNRLWPVLGEPYSAADLVQRGDAYILESDTKFSKVVKGASGELAVGKAFLVYNANGGSLKMNILDGEATAIKGVEVKATRTDNAVYNLQGVRVNKPTANGLYIINGKKYLHK